MTKPKTPFTRFPLKLSSGPTVWGACRSFGYAAGTFLQENPRWPLRAWQCNFAKRSLRSGAPFPREAVARPKRFPKLQ